MYPALSVIFFTTLSGAGYGLWFLTGAAIALNLYPLDRDAILAPLLVGLALTTIGLIASTIHLGKPLRAWRAFSQWRSSWLSREGVAALACVPVALGLMVLVTQLQYNHNIARTLGIVLTLLSAITIFCTARIYSSLKTIQAWCNSYTLPLYLLLGLETGALWFWTLLTLRRYTAGIQADLSTHAMWWQMLLLSLIAIAGLVKLRLWRFLDRAPQTLNTGSAIGLAHLGTVRSFEQPHTEESYLTREMGFVLARRHATRFRQVTLGLLFILPGLLVSTAILLPKFALIAAIAATLCATIGVFFERWLFFAEAKHVVMLYYGNRDKL